MKPIVHSTLLLVMLTTFVSGNGFAQTQDIKINPKNYAYTASSANQYDLVNSTSQSISSTIARPLLFVHGCGGNYYDWYPTLNDIVPALTTNYPQNYPLGSAYVVIFDGVSVHFLDPNTLVEANVSQISKDVKIFVIAFLDPTQNDLNSALNSSNVNQISIIYKAHELAMVIKAIQELTFTKDIQILGHSMGGLVSRMYAEGLAGPIVGTQYNPGSTKYFSNIGSIITLDTPHSGAPVQSSEQGLNSFFLSCNGLNRNEIDPNNAFTVIQALNYVPNANVDGASPKQISNITIRAVKSYNTDVHTDFDAISPSDRVITKGTQDISIALGGIVNSTVNLFNIENDFGISRPSTSIYSNCYHFLNFIYILHSLDCVGVLNQTENILYSGIILDSQTTPLGVASLFFSPTVVGGTNSIGSIQLTAPSPPDGATINLSSNNIAAQVPSSIFVQPNSSITNITVNTSSVSVPQSATITASYGRLLQIAILTINPPAPIAFLSSNSFSFNNSLLGFTSTVQQLVLTNTGTAVLNITSIAVSGDFSQSNNCSSTLAINISCNINVVFKPTVIGTRTGTLTITDNASGSPHVVNLSGQGIDIVISSSRATRPHLNSSPVFNASSIPYDVQIQGVETGTEVVITDCKVGTNEWKCDIAKSMNPLDGIYQINLILNPMRIQNSLRLKKMQSSNVALGNMKVRLHVRINGENKVFTTVLH